MRAKAYNSVTAQWEYIDEAPMGATGPQGPQGDPGGATGNTGSTGPSYSFTVSSATSASTLTPNVDSYDLWALTALSSGLTVNAPTGTATNGKKILFRIADNGTSRSFTWNSIYQQGDIILPSVTDINSVHYIGCIYDSARTKWDVIFVGRNSK